MRFCLRDLGFSHYFCLGVFLFFITATSESQTIDSSSISILESPEAKRSQVDTFDSSRYKVKKATKDKGETPEGLVDEEIEIKPKTTKSTAQNVKKVRSGENSNGEVFSKKDSNIRNKMPEEVSKFQKLIIGGNPEQISEYKNYIEQGDQRLRSFEFSTLISVVNTRAKSISWVRNFDTTDMQGELGLKYWWSPFFGTYINYANIFSGDVVGSVSGTSTSKFSNERFRIGFDLRRFFGFRMQDSYYIISFGFSQSNFRFESDDPNRVSLRSNGPEISWTGFFPGDGFHTWKLGFGVRPFLSHKEQSTGSSYSSGDKGFSFEADLLVGGEFAFDISKSLIWGIKYALEKNSFKNSSIQVDPVAGSILENVSVSTSRALFEIGLKWGF